MAKTLFDIPPQEIVDWPNCRLVMEVSQHIFSYTVLNADNLPVKLKFYEMNAENNRDLKEELEEILNEDEVFHEDIAHKSVIYNFPECELVPVNLFNAEKNKELIELLHGDLNNGTILSEEIIGWQKYNVFRVPGDIHELLRKSADNGSFWHYYSLWIKCSFEKRNDIPNFISVVFYPNRILVAALKDKELQLLQSFSYEVVEDVAFYLLTICNRLGFSAETTPVELTGMIDASSALYTEIFKYFSQTQLDESPIALPGNGSDEFPPHFFSPLLKLAICVS